MRTNPQCPAKEGLADSALCKHCHGPIAVRNPTGECDHLHWPDNLTDEAKRANGFRLVPKQVWEQNA